MGAELEDDQHLLFQTTIDSAGTFTSGPDPNNPTGFTTGNGLAQLMLGVIDNTVPREYKQYGCRDHL